jgi:hypothetical protein
VTLMTELDHLLSGFTEDWLHDFDDEWEMAEDWVVNATTQMRRDLADELDRIFTQHPDAAARWAAIGVPRVFTDREEADRWLIDVRNRVHRALAGDDSQPMVAPPGV